MDMNNIYLQIYTKHIAEDTENILLSNGYKKKRLYGSVQRANYQWGNPSNELCRCVYGIWINKETKIFYRSMEDRYWIPKYENVIFESDLENFFNNI
jgi:hypothetical protein